MSGKHVESFWGSVVGVLEAWADDLSRHVRWTIEWSSRTTTSSPFASAAFTVNFPSPFGVAFI